MLFEDDDFNLSDDDLAQDTQLSIVDEAKLKLITSIEKTAKLLSDNIKFNERSDSESNLEIMNRYLSNLTDLFGLDSQGLSEEEIYEKIEEIEKSTTEITLSNIDQFTKETEETQQGNYNPTDDLGDDLGF